MRFHVHNDADYNAQDVRNNVKQMQEKKEKVKKIICFLFIFLVFASSVFAISANTQINFYGGKPTLTIVYPTFLVFRHNTNTILSFDVLNSSNVRLTNTSTDCVFYCTKRDGSLLTYGKIQYDATNKYWFYNFTNQNLNFTGTASFYAYCNSSNNEAGFVSSSFDITPTGREQRDNSDRVIALVAIAAIFIFSAVLIWAFGRQANMERNE